MSFILDALKKIEEDKRRGEVQQMPDAIAVGAGGGASKRRVFVMIGIAITSAAVTASLLVLGRGVEHTGSAQLAEEAPAESVEVLETSSAVAHDASVSEATGTAAVELPAPEPGPSPAAARPRKAEASREAEVETSPRPPAGTAEPSLPPAANVTTPKAAETADARAATSEEETTAAFRLVGRESPQLYGHPTAGGPAEDEPMNESVAGEVSVPDHFPKLVLQGTSVINGEPVAVINDQRVFEGDSVEGARVLGIEERVVELELEGVRFKIQL